MAEGQGFVIQNTMDEIIDGLYVGSSMAETDKEKLDSCRITHILTVASHYPPTHPDNFVYKSISIDDLPEENIIQYFPECNAFISDALSSGGRILVHCMAGQSRSAAVTVAYIMQKDGIGSEEALRLVREKRPQIYPNAGFLDQLELYYDLGYQVSPDKPLYRRFLISHSAEHYKEYGSIQQIAAGADPSTHKGLPVQRLVRCKKCRRALVSEANILDHQAGVGQVAFSYKKRNANGMDTPHAFPQNRACSSLFVEPMEWMDGVKDGLLENKIVCPKCLAKLGAYNWAGAQCSCGKWITPSFQIHRNRVDEVRQR
ncbi:tyrosine protein phosphatase yvh1 [Coemansia sp. RSA 1722]|nr:tyrosine protein phosphatase yvh1 [Coemansia sp. RSA 486]KAJ2237874.1 tyrosine protein phosphatase yvh1 [Coemansia sp. RSA 485]KAJ2603306.1 tyrosine protein phosphatase yvh1 [Coemansia sp. RSA 1721]KAJ2605935.1 tyrosine protein phosphatase yvh1 [Coemansia sp. RSA 1722]KAJ2639903.1 tyrosine protein phosphatase yvh1 [Coemansia sp. RSA 1286]